MVKVKVAGGAVLVAVTESVPVSVNVYVPLGGSVGAVLVRLLLPHAVIANPAATRAITHARLRNFREERPRNPASSSPAKAKAAGAGFVPVLRPELPLLTTFNRRQPFWEPMVAETQSAALVSRVICALTGDAELTVIDPLLFVPVPANTQRLVSAVSLEVL